MLASTAVAQLVEHEAFNLRVQGSSPCGGVWVLCPIFMRGSRSLVSAYHSRWYGVNPRGFKSHSSQDIYFFYCRCQKSNQFT